MTEASYTAWDDNLYEWPPPEGWYQAPDGKWWPAGYGPGGAVESPSDQSDHPSDADAGPTSVLPTSSPGGSGLDPSATSVLPAGPAEGSGVDPLATSVLPAGLTSPTGPADPAGPDGPSGIDPGVTSVVAAGAGAGDEGEDLGDLSFRAATPEERLAEEARRRVFDELPNIDDVFFGGSDDDDGGTDAGPSTSADAPMDDIVDSEASEAGTELAEVEDSGGEPGHEPPTSVAEPGPAPTENHGVVGVDDGPAPSDTPPVVPFPGGPGITAPAASDDSSFERPGRPFDSVTVDHPRGSVAPTERPFDGVTVEQPSGGPVAGGHVEDHPLEEAGHRPEDEGPAIPETFGQNRFEAGPDVGPHRVEEHPGDSAMPPAGSPSLFGETVAFPASPPQTPPGIGGQQPGVGSEPFASPSSPLLPNIGDPSATRAADATAWSADQTKLTGEAEVNDQWSGPRRPDDSATEAMPEHSYPSQAPAGQGRHEAPGGGGHYGGDQHGESSDIAHLDVAQPESSSRRGRPLLLIGGAIGLVAVLVGAFLFMQSRDSDPDTTEGGSGESTTGSFDAPYSFETAVVVFYNAEEGSEQHRWVVQVLEPVEDGTEEVASSASTETAPAAGEVFAVSRVRVTYQSGPSPGRPDDLVFGVADGQATRYPLADSECPGLADPLDLDVDVDAASSIEGDVCWAVPTAELPNLKLTVEAEPADGTIHMALS